MCCSIARIGLQIGDAQHPGIGMMKRTRHHGGDRSLGQTGPHAVAVETVQRRERRRCHQRTKGDIPEISPQCFRCKDRAGIDLDIEQRPAFRQGQPARHWRAILRVFDGERGPQLPIVLRTRQQTAEQRVPLLGLMAGDSATCFAVHGLLEQFSDPTEQIGQLGKTLLQLGAQLDQMLRHHATDEAVPRPLTALHVLTGLEIGQLLTGAEHELLLGAQITSQFWDALHQPTELARQRMLGKQLGQVLFHLPEPVSRGA